jgi:hypothetical protein
MADFYFTILVSILNIAVPYLVTRHDRKGLDPVQLSRAWNGPSWASAVYFFGPLCLPAHFWVTRRTFVGLLRGTLLAALVFGGEWALGAAIEAMSSG